MSDSDQVAAALENGETLFMEQRFHVTRGVLVPRAVTEVLIRACRSLFRSEEPRLLVDMGCGSGIVGIMLAHAFPEARILSADILPEAVELTRRNVERHGMNERFEVHQSDMFAALVGYTGRVDVIVSSPPFISTGRIEKESSHLLALEPRAAFDAGPYGLTIHQRLIKEGAAMLRPGGYLVFEVGEGQLKQVQRLVERSKVFSMSEEFLDKSGRFAAGLAIKLTAGAPA